MVNDTKDNAPLAHSEMTRAQLQESLKALAKKQELAEWVANGAPVKQAKSILEEFGAKFMSPEKLAQAKAEARLWFEPSAVQQREQDYAGRVNRTQEKQMCMTVDEIKSRVREATHGFAQMFGKTFAQLPIFQQEAIKAMCMHHVGYIPEGHTPYNFNKGVYIGGPSQVGKTSIFAYLKKLPSFNYRIVTSYQLSALAQSVGERGVVEEYSKGQHLVIDEVGWEELALVYGQRIDIVPLIIHARHGQGKITHYTSNFRVEDLRYEEHIKMRIRQGCNVIEAVGANPFMQ